MAVCAALVAGAAKATVITWSGATDTNFEIGTNWGGTAPANNLTADIGLFAGTPTANQPALTVDRAINGLRFDTGGWTLSGGFTLSLGASGINNAAQLSGLDTISAKLGIGAAQTWQVGAGGTLAVTGDVSGSGGLLTIGSATSTGTVTLSGNNTHSAGTTLAGGTLNINSATALGAAAGTFTIAGGTINNTSAGALTLANNNPQAWNGDFAFGGTQDLNLGTGAVTLSAARIITANGTGTLTVGGAVGGAFNITKAGAGNLTLSGAVGTGAGTINVSAGKLTLSNTGNTFTGNINITGGIFETPGGNGGATSAPLGIFTGGTAYKSVNLSNNATFRLTASYNDNVPTAALPGNGQVYVIGTGGGTFDVVGSGVVFTLDDGAGAGTGTGNAQLQGTGTLTKTGLGTLSLGNGTSNFSAFTGAIIVNQGTVAIGVLTTGGFPLGDTSNGTTINSGAVLNLQGQNIGAEPLTISGTGISSGGALISSTGTGTTTGTVTLAADSSIGGAGNLVLSGQVTGGAALTKIGAGTVTLGVTNNYTGLTTVSAGTLTATASAAVPSGLNLTAGTVNANAVGAVAGNVAVGGGTFNESLANALNGTGQTLTVTGGTANLSFGNTYTGGTTVSGTGVVNVTNLSGSATGTGNVTLNSGGRLTSGATASLSGTVLSSAGVGTITPGGIGASGMGAFGTLSIGGLTISSGTGLNYDLTTPTGSNDLINVTGLNTLTAPGGAAPVTFNLTPSAAGTYHLIGFNNDSTGTPFPTAANFSIPTGTANGRLTFTININPVGGNAYFVDLTAAGSGTPITTVFNNPSPLPSATGADWNNAANWSAGVPGLTNDTVTINNGDSTTATTINLNGQQHAGSLTFANTGTSVYTLAAGTGLNSGLFFDTGTLAGPATLVNSTNNNVITAPIVLLSNTNVTVSGTTTLTLGASSIISGPGSLSLTGASTGTLSLTSTAANTFTGGVNINGAGGGTLLVANDGDLGPAPNTVNFTNNGILSYTLNVGGTPTRVFNFGTGGGTLATPGAGTTGKVLLANAGQLTGSGTLTKTGGSDLQIIGANSGFTGNVNINGGFIELQNAAALGSVGTITVNDTGELVGSLPTAFIPNPLAITGTGIIGANQSGTVFSGPLTVPASGSFMLAPRQFQTPTTGTSFTLAGNITGGANLTLTNTQTTQGTVILAGNNTNWTGTVPSLDVNQSVVFGPKGRPGGGTGIAATLNGGVFGLAADGDGFGTPNVAGTFSDAFTLNASSTISVGRLGLGIPAGSALFTTASNKIIEETGPLSIGNVTLAVTNNNGYALRFTGPTTLAAATPTFSVANATFAYQPQGLILQGQVTGANGFIKTGAGTLVLGNSLASNPNFTVANAFTGTITVGQGVLSVDEDSELGTATNFVNLAPTTGTSTLRATGTFSTGRTIQLLSTANTRAIEVTTGKTLTLTSPFDVTGFTTASLAKNDAGTLVLTADNSGWSGGITINQGVVRLTSPNAAGTGAIIIASPVTAAVQITGGITVSNPLTLQGTSVSQNQGVNFGGALQSVGGTLAVPVTNTWAGLITQNSGAATVIGADAFSDLNLTGGITSGNTLLFAGAGNINLTAGTLANSGPLVALGTGTVTISIPDTAAVGNVTSNNGALTLNGLGRFGAGGTVAVNPGGTINVDDSGTATASRLGGKAMTLAGRFNYTVNSTAPSSETLTTLALNSGGSTFNVNPGTGAQASTITFTTLTQNAGSSINFTGALGTATNKIVFTTAPTLVPATTGILARALVNGTDFATYDATNGITAFSAYNANLSAAAVTDTVKLTASTNLGRPQTINGLAISGTGLTVGGGSFAPLTLTSGGLLVTGGANTLSIPIVALGGVEGIFHVASAATATMSGTFTGTAGLTKADAGNLNLSALQYYTGTTTVNGGTLKLGSAANTLFPNNALVVNPGGTLDLNGQAQFIGTLSSAAAGATTNIGGGTITSSLAGATLVANTGSANYSGGLTGTGLAFVRSGTGGTLAILNPLTYTGPTLINGGALSSGGTIQGTTLVDNGALPNTSSININFASLNLNNSSSNAGSSASDSATRVNPLTPITLSGGGFNYYGRASTLSAESIGPVALERGTSIISSTMQTNFGVAPDSATLTLASLTRNAANGATIQFAQNYTNNSTGTLGLINDGAGRSHNIIITAAPTLSNNLIGGWAVTSHFFTTTGAEFATYVPGLGVTDLANPVGNGFTVVTGTPGYDGAAIPAGNQPTQNIRLLAGGTVPSSGAAINALNLASNQTGAVALTFAGANDVLNLTSGGLLVNNVIGSAGATTIGTTLLPGVLTAGGLTPAAASDLYLYNYANGGAATTINSKIADNTSGGTSKVRLVAYGGNWGASNIILAGANTYTGGTIVNQQTLTIGATGVLPAPTTGTGLTINNGTVIQVAGGVIANQSVVLNGGAVMTLVGANTLTSLTFNNIGGTATPTVTTGGVLTLPGNSISASSMNVATTATINGTLDFGGNANAIAITVNPISFNAQTLTTLQPTLNVGAIIQNGGALTYSGGGLLQLSGQSTFAGGVTAGSAGGLVIGGNSTPSTVGSVVTAGPLGTGTLTIATGSTLLASGAFTVANPVTVNGNFTFNGINNLTLNGAATLPAGNTAITVAAPQMTATFGGSVSGTGVSITKQGLGTLAFAGTNAFTGGLTVNGGTVQAAGPAGPTVSPLGTGAVLLNGGGLDLRNNGNGINGTIYVGSGTTTTGYTSVALDPGASGAAINVNNNGANTNNAIQLGTLTMAGGQTLSVTGGNNYSVRFTGTNFTGTGPVNFSPATGVAVEVIGTTTNGLVPVNIGAGTLLLGGNFGFTGGTTITTTNLLGAAPVVNTTATPFGAGQTVTVNSGITVPIVPVIAGSTLTSTGYTQGSLLSQYYNFAVAGLNTAGVSGAVGVSVIGQHLGDVSFRAAPPLLSNVVPVSPNSNIAIYSGLLQIDAGGTYTFGGGSDDMLSISIDGTPVIQDIGSGHALDLQAAKTINLSSGLHSIVIKVANNSSGGGYYVLYNGPDTAGNGITGPTPGMQMIPSSKLFGTADAATAANGFLKAGVVNNAFAVPAAATVTLDGQGTDLNSALGSLDLGASSTLTVGNQLGIGTIGVLGTTTLGTGVTISPTTGMLNLIGGINDGGNGLTKTGNGTLILGNSTAFTGLFAINAGYVQIGAPTALSSSPLPTANTVAANAELDLNGIQGVTGNITLNGSGPSALANSVTTAALVNNRQAPASASGTITLGSATEIQGLGDIALDGVVQDGPVPAAAIGKFGPNTLSLNGNNTFTGVFTIGQGIVKLGHANGLGASAVASNTIFTAGAALDVNGQTSPEPLSITGAGVTNLIGKNTLGVLFNSGPAATLSGPVTMLATSSIGGNSLAAGSATATPAAGDLTISGVLGGAFLFTKVGGNTLYLTNGANTFTNFAVNLGTVRLQDAGKLASANTQNTVNSGGTIVLDNTGTAVSERLGNRGLFINGNLTILGNATTAVAETINTGANNFNFANSAAVITLDASAGEGVTVTVNSSATSMFSRTAGATALIRGTGLGVSSGFGFGSILGTGTSTGGTQNNGQSVGQAGAFGNPNRLIMQWALVDSTVNGLGTSFGTFSLTGGITALLPSETSSTLTANNNILLASTETVAAASTLVINSLTLGESTGLGASGGVIVPAGSSLQFDSGGILAFSNNSGIMGGGTLTATNTFNRELVIHTVGSATSLNIATPIYSVAGGLTKADGGTLLLSAQENYLGNTVVNGGTLKLNGGNQTIFEPFATAPAPGNTAAGISGQVLQVNLGGTLDLNGFNQSVINFNSAGTLPGIGGTVTNSAVGAPATFRIGQQTNQTFAGNITGNLNFVREGNNTLALTAPNTYTGSTTITGGFTDLVDLGALQSTSGINIRRAVLRWNDSGIQAVGNRINPAAGINLDGGAFSFVGRTGTQATATVGAITLNSGANWIGSSGTNGTAVLTLASVTRTANIGAAVSFVAGTSSRAGALADQERIVITAPPALTNGIIGAWATVLNGSDIPNNAASFATYDPAAGVRGLGGYNYATTFAAGNNMRITVAGAVPTGGATTNSLTMSGAAAFDLTFAAPTDTLTLQSGGLLIGLDNFAHSVSTVVDSGRLTTSPGQQELFIHNGANTLTVNARIIDNGAPLNVVLDALSQAGPAITLTGANTYTGTTYANGVIVNLNSPTGLAIPGNLIISGGNNFGADSLPQANAAMTLLRSNQIADAATVTLQGGTLLNLNGFNETIAALRFTSDGGSNGAQGPTVQTGPGTLTIASGGIVATNLSNAFNIATVNGFLNLPGAQVISVDNSSAVPGQIGLELNAAITNSGGLTKMGAGVLGIGGKSGNFTGPLLVNVGTVAIGASTANIGQSAVTLAAGTTLDLRGLNGVIGGLNGAGTVTNFNQTTGGTLTTGLKGAPASFTGTFTNPFVRGLLSVTKVGAGTLNLGGDSSGVTAGTSGNLGTLTVNGGAVTLDSASGKVGFTTYTLNSTGTINIDDSTNNVPNRLGGVFQLTSAAVLNTTTPRVLNLQGGSINIIGPSAGDLAEGFGTVAVTNGASTLTINPAAAGTSTITLNTLGNIANSGPLGGTLLLRGAGLGGIAGPGVTNVLVNTAPQLIGGGGAAGTRTMSVRPDIIGDLSPTGTGTGFVTYIAGTGFRLLDTATELQASPGTYGKLLPAITTTGSPAVIVPSTTGLVIGQTVTGTGIPAGATIAGIDVPSNTITLSAAATANGRVVATFGVVATSNVTSMTASTFNASTTLNSLVLNSGAGITSTGAGQLGQIYSPAGTVNQFIVTSGGILAQVGNTGIVGGQLTTNTTNELILDTVGDLAMGAFITAATGTQGVTKSGGGALSYNVPQYYTGTTTVNGGTLLLNSGQANTIMVTPTNNIPALVDLRVNAGTVDLKGKNQAVGTLSNNNPIAGTGGTITSTAAAGLTTSTTVASTFSGSINGAIALTKAGSSTLTLTGANGYTGPTTVIGGTLLVRDSGTLLGTSGITLNFGTLQLDDTGLVNITPRIPVVPISMSGGALTFSGDQSIDSATVGTVTSVRGNNTITLSQITSNLTGRFGLTINNLSRATGSFVNFTSAGTNANLGDIGGSPAIFLNQLEGVPFSSTNLVNGIIGGWAVVAGSEFASYVNAQGISRLSGTGYPGYGSTDITTATVLQNVNDGTSRTLAATKAVNSWRIAPNAANTVTIGAAGVPQTLTIASGGLLTNNNNTFVIAQGDTTGFASAITSGTSELDVFVNQNTTTIGVKIVNGIGAAATMSLVKGGGGALTLSPGASNTYSGPTIVNQGTLNLGAGVGVTVIPGDITINNAAVTHTTANAGQIATGSNVTIVGGGTLTMPNAQNFLGSLIFNGIGGTTTPTVATGTSSLTLGAQNAIVSNNDNFATTPTISGGAIAFGYEFGPTIVSTSGTSPVDLRISAPITSVLGGALVKTGPGSISLDGNNLYTTGFQLTDGALIADNNAAVGTVAGTFTIGDAVTAPTVPLTIMSGTTIRTLLSPVVVNRDFTFGGTVAVNGLILGGTVDFLGINRTITVSSPLVTSTLSGVLTATAGLTKAGPGVLVLSNATNNFGATPTVVVNGGILKDGAAGAIPAGTDLTVAAGAEFDQAGIAQVLRTLSGAGLVGNSGAAQTLSIGGLTATDVTTNANSIFSGVIANGTNALTLQKVGLGSLTLNGSSIYTGGTTLVTGSIVVGTDNALPTTSVLTMGNATTATNSPSLLVNANQTLAGLVVSTNNAAATDTITIAAGKTLTVEGNVTLGSNLSATDTTKVIFNGGGALAVNRDGGVFQVGGATGATNADTTTVDMTALGSFSTNLGATGIFRVGDNNSGVSLDNTTLTLAPTNTITAGTFGVGDATAGNVATVTLKLGSGVNTINASVISIGANTQRATGILQFNTGTGTLKVRALDGIGRANLNQINGGAGTGATLVSTIDLTGHSADLLLNTWTMSARSGGSAGAGNATSTFTFDTGTLDATMLVLSNKTGTTNFTATSTATVNINGGTATFGSILMAGNSSTGGAGGSSTGTLNLTGGVVTLNGDITKIGTTAGTGTTTANITLNGATLDLTGHNIGSGTAGQLINTLNLQSGTLKNVLQINGGAGITKTTAGVLTLDGTNNFTGPAVVSQGTLRVAATGTFVGAHTLSVSSGAIAQINGSVSGGGSFAVNSGGTLQGIGTISDPTSIASTAVVAPGPGLSTLTFADTSLTLASGARYQYESGSGVTDRIRLTGVNSTLTLTAWTLQLADLSTDAPQGRVFVLFDGDTAATAQLNLGSIGTPTIDYGTTGWSGGTISYVPGTNDIVLTGVIPEPSSWSMLVGSLSLALGLQRFRRRRA
ncbi:MAG: hypothetical protein QOE70_6366 [Chthoniobacter sp.]|jgi:autotransporter-associated beta strand protein|nr:hypothetical protein [Chthoniobacter sp.]